MSDEPRFWQSRAFRARIIVYGGLLLLAWALLPRWVHHMTYPVPMEPVPSPPPPPITEVTLVNQAGENLMAWFLPCPQENAPLVIFFHGNGQDLGNMLYSGFLHRFPAMGVNLLALDYPGYGNSEGTPGEAVIIESAELAMDWALATYPSTPKILMGWSLGAGVALQTAQSFSGHYDGLLLVSPWTGIKDVARAHYPNWMVSLLMRETYDSRAAARQVNTPSLVIHGEVDQIIPSSQGAEIAGILGEIQKSQLIMVKDRGHNDVLNAGLTWTQIEHFLDQFKAEP